MRVFVINCGISGKKCYGASEVQFVSTIETNVPNASNVLPFVPTGV